MNIVKNAATKAFSEQDGYDFAVEVVVNDIPLAVVHVQAQTFNEAKQRVLQAVRVQTADRLLPIIVLNEDQNRFN